MRSFGSHLVMLLVGLSAGVVLAVVGFNPMANSERITAPGRPATLGRADPATRRVRERSDSPVATAPTPESKSEAAAVEPRAPTRQAYDRGPTPTDGSIHGRLDVDPPEAYSAFGVVVSRVAFFDPTDPELLASSFDSYYSGYRPATRCMRVHEGRFDFQLLPPGNYWLVAVLGGQAVGERQVELAAGASVEADLAVAAAPAQLRMNLVDERDGPLSDAQFAIETTLESALGPKTTMSVPPRVWPVVGGHFRLFLPAVAASVRAGRLAGTSTLTVDCYGFESQKVPLVNLGTDETTIRLIRKKRFTTAALRIHIVRAPSGRRPDSIGVQMLGPMPTDKDPNAHEVGFWRDVETGDDALFAALPPGLYQLNVVARAGDGLPPTTILTRNVDVAEDPEPLTVELPRLFRITVVAPAELAALRAELAEPGAADGAPPQATALGCETHFPLVAEGLHEIRFGPRRMRLDVHDDRRVDFIADPALEAGGRGGGR
jgi:hypothetical protein